jgi:hypothetical protein
MCHSWEILLCVPPSTHVSQSQSWWCSCCWWNIKGIIASYILSISLIFFWIVYRRVSSGPTNSMCNADKKETPEVLWLISELVLGSVSGMPVTQLHPFLCDSWFTGAE